MINSKFFKRVVLVFTLTLALSPVLSVLAVETVATTASTGAVTEITSEEAGVSVQDAATVTEEDTTIVTESGTLIEIGNTTAEETTIIIRVVRDGATVDQTVQITASTKIRTNANRPADLSDWIAGDHLRYIAAKGNNSGELVATEIQNLSFNIRHHGKNGWIKEIRVDENEMDVEWAGKIYTLNTEDARMVAGLKNPASLEDFQVDDRIRARVSDDDDGDTLTWDAEIIVVLRRGDDLFMRVTRWVVSAELVSISDDTTLPYVVTAKVLPSKFYEAGDVNNLIGAPGTEISIEINENTRLVRRYLGRADIGEFIEGDKIRVVGRLNEGTGNIDADLVKNNSIQRLGVSSHISEVLSVDVSSNTLIAKPIGLRNPLTGKRVRIPNGLSWTVRLNDNTVIKELGEDIMLNDVEAGDIIRVRGTANLKNVTVDVNAISVITTMLVHLLEK